MTNSTCPMADCTSSIRRPCKSMKIARRDPWQASRSVRRPISRWISRRKALASSSSTSSPQLPLIISSKHWGIPKSPQTSAAMQEAFSKYPDPPQEYLRWMKCRSKSLASKGAPQETKNSRVTLCIKPQPMERPLRSKEFFLKVKIKWQEMAWLQLAQAIAHLLRSEESCLKRKRLCLFYQELRHLLTIRCCLISSLLSKMRVRCMREVSTGQLCLLRTNYLSRITWCSIIKIQTTHITWWCLDSPSPPHHSKACTLLWHVRPNMAGLIRWTPNNNKWACTSSSWCFNRNLSLIWMILTALS